MRSETLLTVLLKHYDITKQTYKDLCEVGRDWFILNMTAIHTLYRRRHELIYIANELRPKLRWLLHKRGHLDVLCRL
jgi:hypothetical protein